MKKVVTDLYERYFSEEEALIFTMLIVVGLGIMLTMGSIIAPLLWSIVIAYLLQGLVNSLNRAHLPRKIAIYLVYLFFLSISAVIIFIFLPFTWSRLSIFISEMPNMFSQLEITLLALAEEYPDLFTRQQVQSWMSSTQSEMAQYGQDLLSRSVSTIPRLVTWMVYTILVPILVFFMLKDSVKLLNWLENWLPEKRPIMAQIWHEMNDQLANYIRGKALEILIMGSVSYLVLVLFGINYPVLMATLIGFSVLIPFVGAAAAAIPLGLVGYFQWGFGAELYQVMIVYTVIQMIDGNILVPLIFSETVNLHPIAIITAVLVFGGVWGFWGVFFAIPLATFIKAVIRAWPVSHKLDSADIP